jgi:hypothetical protein
VLSNKNAKIDGQTFEFTIPGTALVSTADGWKKLRLGFSVDWQEKSATIPTSASVSSTSISPPRTNSADWQPLDGKATVVIENETGARLRNLVSSIARKRTPHARLGRARHSLGKGSALLW